MIKDFDSEKALGLSSDTANDILRKNGENVLAGKKKTSAISIFTGQFKDAMVLILLCATAISAAMGEYYDALTIVIIVVINAILGFIQEFRTEKTIEALKKFAAPTARVFRDGKLTELPAAKLVVGDVIQLEAGDRVPADCQVISVMSMECDESILTGESVPVTKISGNCDGNKLNQNTAVYMGATVTKGHGLCKILATGKSTQMGQISDMLSEISEEQTPLQKKLAELGKIIGIACIVICILVSLAGVLRGFALFDMLFVGISLAVAAIPEGLPATVTISLALAVRQIYKQHALVNKLHSVETLGCTSVICTDKTGTLTQNKMTVTEIYTSNGLQNIGANGKIAADNLSKSLFVCGVVCNNAVLRNGECIGDPTEGALITVAERCLGNGVSADKYKRVGEVPFDSNTRFMAVTTLADGERKTYVKGAVDVIIERCGFIETNQGIVSFTQKHKREIMDAVDKMTTKALRSLAFAEKKGDFSSGKELVFLGLQGMSDPLRPQIKSAVKRCKKAGIKTVMITGDHKNTAFEIARQAGIISANSIVLTGAELDKMNDRELVSIIERVAVFARVSPANKLRIVRAFKAVGHVVAMTGDGVNDAPAVKEADIGVSMGITGTDVTKEAAQLVLLDDNFATLVNTVEQGRTIYANIRKFVRYMLSCNIGEVITMLVAMLCGMPVVLVPIQILLINLVTDGLPAIALGMEPPTKNIMNIPPRKPTESIFANGMFFRIISRGILIGICTLLSFSMVLNSSGDIICARTAALITLGLSQLVFVFECKDEEATIFTTNYLNNFKLILACLISLGVMIAAVFLDWLTPVFQTSVLDMGDVLVSIGFSFAVPVIRGIIYLFRK